MPGPAQAIVLPPGVLVVLTKDQLASTTCGLPKPGCTTKSKLWADKVLRINSMLHRLFRQTPAPVVLLHVKFAGQRSGVGAVRLHAVVVVHSVSCENNWELSCWKRWS